MHQIQLRKNPTPALSPSYLGYLSPSLLTCPDATAETALTSINSALAWARIQDLLRENVFASDSLKFDYTLVRAQNNTSWKRTYTFRLLYHKDDNGDNK